MPSGFAWPVVKSWKFCISAFQMFRSNCTCSSLRSHSFFQSYPFDAFSIGHENFWTRMVPVSFVRSSGIWKK
jgi:hypothetical protein